MNSHERATLLGCLHDVLAHSWKRIWYAIKVEADVLYNAIKWKLRQPLYSRSDTFVTNYFIFRFQYYFGITSFNDSQVLHLSPETVALRRRMNIILDDYDISVAMAWSLESLLSNPAARVRFPAARVRIQTGSGILISVLGLGLCSLSVFYSVLSSAEALTLC